MVKMVTDCAAVLLSLFVLVTGKCCRTTSRLIRSVFMQDLEPVYQQLELSMPSGCVFSLQRDMYAFQELHKYSDSPGKWVCGFCGKAFYDQQYLDRHYDRRHTNTILEGDSVSCLADYCDIFRCDIRTSQVTAHYWDVALCKELDMNKLQDKCQCTVGECIPDNISTHQKQLLVEAFNKAVCSYLTCEQYWQATDKPVRSSSLVFYIVGGVFLVFILFIYYYIAYTHFFTDESLLDGSRRYNRSGSLNVKPSYADQSLRFRHR